MRSMFAWCFEPALVQLRRQPNMVRERKESAESQVHNDGVFESQKRQFCLYFWNDCRSVLACMSMSFPLPAVDKSVQACICTA
jgi:hypothetical protein